MTQKLADQLIAWYEESIEQIDQVPVDNIEAVKNVLYNRNVDDGVCYCARMEFEDISLYASTWIKSFGKAWWFDTPIDAKTKEEVIELLQKRVDRLKTFSEPDTNTPA